MTITNSPTPSSATTATTTDGAQAYFNELIDWAVQGLQADEVLLAQVQGENSDFVRFNQGSVRQAGSVQQRDLSIDLIQGDRHAEGQLQLTQDLEMDRARVAATLSQLREIRAVAPADPFLSFETAGARASGELRHPGATPESGWAVDQIQAASSGQDLVGIYASGDSFAGFASSLGQRNWYSSSTFNFDWCFYLQADKAVKNTYAGRQWDESAFTTKVGWSAQQLDVLGRKPVELSPGAYRSFLTPAAMAELMDLLSRGGFGLKAHRTHQTPLLRMAADGARFHPEVSIVEDVANGAAPNFSAQGFARPDQISLIDQGAYADHLVSARSAIEYDVATNGASTGESPDSLAIATGSLDGDAVLGELDTGLYVGNLWYLNFSDRAACRTTGMTRFATFWVENGEVVAPANVLRFDDTAFNLLGSNLEGLTSESELMLDPATYGARSLSSMRLPGALVNDMRFTL